MPIYEYQCRDCGGRSSIFFRSISAAESATPKCERCESTALGRLISRAIVMKGTAGRIDDFDVGNALNDVGKTGMMDPGSFARWARKMGDEMGEEMGAKFRDLADQADAGADPLERVDPAHTLQYELDKQRGAAQGLSSDEDDGVDDPKDF